MVESSIPGDCDDDGTTSIDELVRGVRIALGIEGLDSCPALDRNGDRAVTVDELVRAVATVLAAPHQAFGNPKRVTIRGYDATAMEPFVTRDGRYLFFDESNAPSADTNLHYAEHIDDVTFEYRGEIAGVNTPGLDAVASMDRQGRFYFVSTRSYPDTLSTIYSGSFATGGVADVELVRGVSMQVSGQLNFDAEISPDGNTLYFVDGVFTGGAAPVAADLAIAVRRSGAFERLREGPAGYAVISPAGAPAFSITSPHPVPLPVSRFHQLQAVGRIAGTTLLISRSGPAAHPDCGRGNLVFSRPPAPGAAGSR